MAYAVFGAMTMQGANPPWKKWSARAGDVDDRIRSWPYLTLVRPANLITAAADVLAGYAVAGLPAPHTLLPLLVVSGILLYAGGVVMNDVFDAALDARDRPERPIPSGRVRRALAGMLGLALLLAGVATASAAGMVSGLIAGVLAITALLYDATAKHHRWLGPLAMGICRGLNLLLGLSAAPVMMANLGEIALVPMLYVAAVTLASDGEVDGGDRRTLALVLVMLATALALLPALAQQPLLTLAPFAVLLAVRVGAPFWAAWRRPCAMLVRAAVKRAVLSIIVLDAAIAAACAGVAWGLLVLVLVLPAARLSVRFAVT